MECRRGGVRVNRSDGEAREGIDCRHCWLWAASCKGGSSQEGQL